jgi:hypothetical protein
MPEFFGRCPHGFVRERDPFFFYTRQLLLVHASAYKRYSTEVYWLRATTSSLQHVTMIAHPQNIKALVVPT